MKIKELFDKLNLPVQEMAEFVELYKSGDFKSLEEFIKEKSENKLEESELNTIIEGLKNNLNEDKYADVEQFFKDMDSKKIEKFFKIIKKKTKDDEDFAKKFLDFVSLEMQMKKLPSAVKEDINLEEGPFGDKISQIANEINARILKLSDYLKKKDDSAKKLAKELISIQKVLNKAHNYAKSLNEEREDINNTEDKKNTVEEKNMKNFEKGKNDFLNGSVDTDLMLESNEYREGYKEAKEEQEAELNRPITVKEFNAVNEKIDTILEAINNLKTVEETVEEDETVEENVEETVLDRIDENLKNEIESLLNEDEVNVSKVLELVNENSKKLGDEENDVVEYIANQLNKDLDESEKIVIDLENVIEEDETDDSDETVEENKEDENVEDNKDETVEENVEDNNDELLNEAKKDLSEADKIRFDKLIESAEYDSKEDLAKAIEVILKTFEEEEEEEEEDKEKRLEEEKKAKWESVLI